MFLCWQYAYWWSACWWMKWLLIIEFWVKISVNSLKSVIITPFHVVYQFLQFNLIFSQYMEEISITFLWYRCLFKIRSSKFIPQNSFLLWHFPNVDVTEKIHYRLEMHVLGPCQFSFFPHAGLFQFCTNAQM